MNIKDIIIPRAHGIIIDRKKYDWAKLIPTPTLEDDDKVLLVKNSKYVLSDLPQGELIIPDTPIESDTDNNSDKLYLYSDRDTLKLGDIVTIYYTIATNHIVGNVRTLMSYDEEILEFVRCDFAPWVNTGVFKLKSDIDPTDSYQISTWPKWPSDTNMYGHFSMSPSRKPNGNIFEVSFKVKKIPVQELTIIHGAVELGADNIPLETSISLNIVCNHDWQIYHTNDENGNSVDLDYVPFVQFIPPEYINSDTNTIDWDGYNEYSENGGVTIIYGRRCNICGISQLILPDGYKDRCTNCGSDNTLHYEYPPSVDPTTGELNNRLIRKIVCLDCGNKTFEEIETN